LDSSLNTLQCDDSTIKLQGMYSSEAVTDKLKKLVKAFRSWWSAGRDRWQTTLLRHVFPDLDYVAFDPSIDVEERARRV